MSVGYDRFQSTRNYRNHREIFYLRREEGELTDLLFRRRDEMVHRYQDQRLERSQKHLDQRSQMESELARLQRRTEEDNAQREAERRQNNLRKEQEFYKNYSNDWNSKMEQRKQRREVQQQQHQKNHMESELNCRNKLIQLDKKTNLYNTRKERREEEKLNAPLARAKIVSDTGSSRRNNESYKKNVYDIQQISEIEKIPKIPENIPSDLSPKKEKSILGEIPENIPSDLSPKKENPILGEIPDPESLTTIEKQKWEVIVIQGPPGSGKGTQSKKLSSYFGYGHISTGDLLRQEIKSNSERGQQISEIMSSGNSVPDDLVTLLVKEIMEKGEHKKWILDGYPRTTVQAQTLLDAGCKPTKVIILNVPPEALIERVCGRRLDPVSGVIYHLKHMPPPDDALDRLIQRKDDVEEVLEGRLVRFNNNIAKVREFFQENVVELDGHKTQEEVFKDILALEIFAEKL